MILDWSSFNEGKRDHDAFPKDEINSILNIARDEDLVVDVHWGYARKFDSAILLGGNSRRLTYAAIISRFERDGREIRELMEEEQFKKICLEIEERMSLLINSHGDFDITYLPGAYHSTVTGYKITYWV